MRICVYGAGAIGGFIGARLAQAGEDVTLLARGPHLAAMRERGLRLLADGRKPPSGPRPRQCCEAGEQDYDRRPQGLGRGRRRRGDAAAAGPRDGGGHGGERPALVVFPWARGTLARPAAQEPRSRGQAMAGHRPGAGHRLRRLSRGGGRGARRDPPYLGRPLQPRRARRQPLAPGRGAEPRPSSAPASRHRSRPTSGPRSGSSSGAMSPSTPSAR
jgi:Ketopantoate reductase